MSRRQEILAFSGVMLVLLCLHFQNGWRSEAYYNNDETRHTMTGIFFHDAYQDLSTFIRNPAGYAKRYYGQYPALGLLVWPPLFYAFEGFGMLVLGPSFETGRVCVALFSLVGLIFAYRWMRMFLDPRSGILAVLLLGFCPMLFLYSQRVMLEMPTFALGITAVYYFDRYVEGSTRRRDAVLACLFSAFTFLTRYDAIYLLPYFGLRLVLAGQVKLLLQREVILGVLLACALAGPYYLLAAREYGSMLEFSVKQGTSQVETQLPLHHIIFYYPNCLWEQAGFAIPIMLGFSLLAILYTRDRKLMPPMLLILSVYVVFTIIAERAARHAIYWLPGVVGLSVYGLRIVPRPLAILLAGAMLGSSYYDATSQALRYLFGYGEAARYVIARGDPARPIFFDGELNGGLIIQMRLNDPERRFWVLRGDKLLYTVLCDAITIYQERVTTDGEILKLLHEYDPEYLVIEEPQLNAPVPIGQRLRALLPARPDLFEPVERIPIRTNHVAYQERGTHLVIYRKRTVNPDRTTRVDIPVLGLGKTLETQR